MQPFYVIQNGGKLLDPIGRLSVGCLWLIIYISFIFIYLYSFIFLLWPLIDSLEYLKVSLNKQTNSYFMLQLMLICPNFVLVLILYPCIGFGGLEVACWPLVPKFAGSNPAEAVRFLRAKKNPQHAFLRTSVPCRRFAACKRSLELEVVF
jgi:hypothetical protein